MSETPTILKKILARKQQEVAERQSLVSAGTLQKKLESAPPCRGFIEALTNKVKSKQAAVVAEIKKASPSKGVLCENFDPVSIAKSYQQYGATCLSVLTDVDFFQGADNYLVAVRKSVSIPVIRKDFIVDSYQVLESRVLGADCILLIAAALSETQLQQYYTEATALGMDVLIEVHNETELAQALKLPTRLIGINNRNLHTFEVSLDTTLSMLNKIPEDRIVITESGIMTKGDVALMQSAGVFAFLVGESFMRASNPGQQLAALFYG